MIKVQRAVMYECKHSGFPSENNAVHELPVKEFDGKSHVSILEAFQLFATFKARSQLVLELEDGRKIQLIPTLKSENPVVWEISADISPA